MPTLCGLRGVPCRPHRDRKSTRLNSSHTVISYAVFCLKKKKTSLNSSHTVISDAVFCLEKKLNLNENSNTAGGSCVSVRNQLVTLIVVHHSTTINRYAS